VGFDYMGLSMDFLGGKIYDSPSVGTTLSTTQVNQITSNQVGPSIAGVGYAIPCSLGCLSAVVSDDTVFQVGIRYTLGPWKFYGGYEHLTFSNPNNPLAPGAFDYGGYNLGITNNNNYFTNRNQNNFWVGVKYSVTPTLDIAAAYYGQRQDFYIQGAGASALTLTNAPGAAVANVNQAAAC